MGQTSIRTATQQQPDDMGTPPISRNTPVGSLHSSYREESGLLKCNQVWFTKGKKKVPFQFKYFTEAWNSQDIIAILRQIP